MKKILFITGGSGDIGKAIVDEFAKNSYEIIAPGSKELNLNDLQVIEDYIKSFPKLDAFIHCAGINRPKLIQDIEISDLEDTCNINAFSFYKIINSLAKQEKLKQNGHILAISSIYGSISRAGRFSYTASKACLEGMVKNCALELGNLYGIKVNALAPGFVDTKLTIQNNSKEIIEKLLEDIPLKKMAHPCDIAKIAYFLASDDNQYINGQTIIADGGYLAGGFQI